MAQIKPPPEIKINTFQAGIGTSYLTGFHDMRGLDVESIPGVARINYRLSSQRPPAVSTTFTANPATDVITTAATFVWTPNATSVDSLYRPVTLTTTGTLPAGLTTSTVYYLSGFITSLTYKLATSIANANAGTWIDITDAGTGTHTITSVDMGEPMYITSDNKSTNTTYVQDSNGRVWGEVGGGTPWLLIAGNTLTGGGKGLVYYSGYLLAFRSGGSISIDVLAADTFAINYGITWTNGWLTPAINSAAPTFPTRVARDNRIYIGNGTQLDSIRTNTGKTFNPSDATTYTYTAGCLTFVANNVVTCLSELGGKLEVGMSTNKVILWDKTSTTFNDQIIIPEYPVYTMSSLENVSYIFAGRLGNIYATNGSSVQKVKQLPEDITGAKFGSTATSCMFGSSIPLNAKIYFTFVGSGTADGVYSFNPATGVLIMESPVSTNSYSLLSSNVIYPTGTKSYICGWNAGNNTLGLDSTQGLVNMRPLTNYTAYLISPLFDIGTYLNKRALSQLEIHLTKPMVSGQGIRVSWRNTAGSSFSTPKVVDFSTYGAIDAYLVNMDGYSDDHIQVKIEFTVSDAAQDSSLSPELKEIIIR